MRRLFFALLLVVAAFMPANADTHKQFESSVFKVINKFKGHGTSFHIGNGQFVTAKHVLHGSKILKLVGEDNTELSAFVAHSFQNSDLAVLKTFNDGVPATSIDIECRKTQRGDEVSSIGYPAVFEHTTTYGRIASGEVEREPLEMVFLMDMNIITGQSGSPVLDKSGKAVGVVSSVIKNGNGGMSGYSVAVSIAPICEFLSES